MRIWRNRCISKYTRNISLFWPEMDKKKLLEKQDLFFFGFLVENRGSWNAELNAKPKRGSSKRENCFLEIWTMRKPLSMQIMKDTYNIGSRSIQILFFSSSVKIDGISLTGCCTAEVMVVLEKNSGFFLRPQGICLRCQIRLWFTASYFF